MNFYDFRVFVFRYRTQNENPEITENSCLWVFKVQIYVDLFFYHYFNFLSAKTKINKSQLNLINLDGSEAPKRQICSTLGTGWIILRFTWFEEHLNCFSKLHSYILVLWLSCRISVVSELSFFGERAQNKNPDTAENLYFPAFSSQTLLNSVLCLSFFIFIGRIYNFLV